ncbi:hypothetical protein WA026_023433 [Henosepilachna vigintioctopunctata]|uniref:Uncharacterized protein n=1 Tax=Henosepilachna vigintioctopunctata TaxID=420089 RepID=A0AAW1UGS2_9CUCU
MKLLYDQGKGKVYLNCIKWLECDDNELLGTAIMAVGNFARNDENCTAIVKEGISKKLIGLLNKYTIENPDIKLLHGLLSTLKNLVVPSKNKSIILEEGLIQTVQPILEIDQDIVIFKLLGTLRLVIDGQEKAAKDLISQKKLLEKLVQIFDNTYHLGVKREVSRFLAWLIKSCHSWDSMRNILQVERTIDCLVSMFSSEDYIMENEALISLNLLSAATIHANDITGIKESSSNDKILKVMFEEQLIKLQIAVVLPYVRIFSHNNKIAENLISLLEKFLQSLILLDHFREKMYGKF